MDPIRRVCRPIPTGIATFQKPGCRSADAWPCLIRSRAPKPRFSIMRRYDSLRTFVIAKIERSNANRVSFRVGGLRNHGIPRVIPLSPIHCHLRATTRQIHTPNLGLNYRTCSPGCLVGTHTSRRMGLRVRPYDHNTGAEIDPLRSHPASHVPNACLYGAD